MKNNKAIILLTSLVIILVVSGFSLLFVSTFRLKKYVDKYFIYEQVEAKVINYVMKDNNKKAIIVEYKVNQDSYKLESKVFKRRNLEKGEVVNIAYNVDEPGEAIWMPWNENNVSNYVLLVVSLGLMMFSIVVSLLDYRLIKSNMIEEYDREDNGFYYAKILNDGVKGKIIVLVMMLVVPCFVKADDLDSYVNYDYIIDKLDVEIKVNENNTYDVVETIDVNYNYQKRSIYRRIPLYSTFPRLDGIDLEKRVQISNLEVNEKYSKTIVNRDLVIKIGDNKNTLEGNHYVFKYTYNVGKDELRNKDEFIFNIVGKDWDTIIKIVTFSIVMPKDFDSNKVVILQGTSDVLSEDNVDYKIEDNVIKGRVKVNNKPAEYVYARIELEDGYFINAKYKFDYKVIFMFIIPSIMGVGCYFMWRKYGKEKKGILENRVSIDNYNSMEVEYLYYGNSSLRGVALLLYDLANKGKVRIRRVKREESIINQEEHIIEIFDRSNLKPVESYFIEGLLKCRKEHTLNQIKDNEIMVSDLSNDFYRFLYTIQDSINNRKNREWLFLNRTKEKTITFMMLFIALMAIVMVPVLGFSSIVSACLVVLLLIVYLPFIGILVSKNRIDGMLRIFLLAFLVVDLVMMFSLTPLYDAIMYDKAYLVGFVYGMIAEIVMFVFLLNMGKRTEEGKAKLMEIVGFRQNIRDMKREDFNRMMIEDKNYYYRIYPYIKGLNIYEYVREKIDIENICVPEWLDNGDDIDKKDIDGYVNSLINEIYEAMSSVK